MMDTDSMVIDSSIDQTGSINSNNHHKKESNNELAHLKNSVLSFISSHNEPPSKVRVGSEYATIVASVFDQHVQDPKVHYSRVVQKINALISSHTFNRNMLLSALLQASDTSLPPLAFVHNLHAHDILSLSDFIEALHAPRRDEFVQMVKEAFDPSSSSSAFEDIIVCLVELGFEKSGSSIASGMLDKICDTNGGSANFKRLLHVLKRVSKMRPAKIPSYFFSIRLHSISRNQGPNSELAILEDRVKKILNPPSDGKVTEDSEAREILNKIFSEFCNVLSIDDILTGLTKTILSLQCDWDIVVKFVQFLISNVRDFGTRMADPLHNLAKEAITNVNEDLLKVALMLSWIVLPFNLYIDWFTNNFCAATTTMIPSKNLRQFLAKVMAALVYVESIELARHHRSIIKKHPELKAVMQDYMNVDRMAPASSSIGRTVSLDDAIVNVRNFLESFRQQGSIPEKLKTMPYFGPVFFRSTFIPVMLSIEEEQKHTPVPEYKDIHLFTKALQGQGLVTQNDILAWKASQDEHIAKLRAARRLAKGKNTDRVGKRVIDPLKSLLREFVDRTIVNNFKDSSLIPEIASRVNSILSTHNDQAIPCVNLLLHAFCEISALLGKAHKEGIKGPGVQLTGDFVRRVLMLPCVRSTARDRVRELVCDLALELDDVHITCLALFLAYMAATTEREGPTGHSAFLNDVFRRLHANIRNFSWMGYAAKLTSKFISAVPVISSYVIVPDSLEDTPTDDNEPMTDSAYDYSIVPPLALKLLMWLKARYSFGHQVIALCSSHTTLHHHTPTFIDFSTTATLLHAALPPSTYSHTLARLSGGFTLEEFVNAEMRVASCGDFLDGVWKVEYIRKMFRETFLATQPFSSFLESLLRAWFRAGDSGSEGVCACSKTECSGKSAVLTAIAEFVDSENIDAVLIFVEKEFENPLKAQSSSEMMGLLSKSLQLLAPVHPSALNLIAVKNLLYTFAPYLKFLVPFQASALPHTVTHPAALLFVLIARIFGSLVRKQPELAGTVKDLIEHAPYGFFFALHAPLYRNSSIFVGVEESVASKIYSSLDSTHSWIQALMQGQCNPTNLKEIVQNVTQLPTVASHVLFHSIFSLSDPLPMSHQTLHDKVSKLEPLLSLLCDTLTNLKTLEAISHDKTFEFLANFTDILVYHLSTSSTYNLKQLHSCNPLPTLPLNQRESVDDIVECLLTLLLVRQPFLLAVLTHPPVLPFLATGRTSLFPSFSLSPTTFSTRYPLILLLSLSSIPSTILGKILGGIPGILWQEIILDSFEISLKTRSSEPNYTFLMSGTFREKAEEWICGWIEECGGVDERVAERMIPSLDISAPRISSALRQFTLLSPSSEKRGKEREEKSRVNSTTGMVKRNLFNNTDQP